MFKKNCHFLEQGQFLPALDALKRAEIIAFDTDTVPGVAVNALDIHAVQKLYALKNRSSEKKFVWFIDDWAKFSHYFTFSPQIDRLLQKLWPGPFTLVFQQHQGQKQAVRIPRDEYLLHFLAQCPFPLAVTSANKSGKPAADSLQKVWDIFGEKIAFYLPHTVASTKKPSLVLDISEGRCNVLRLGDEKMARKLQRCVKDVGLEKV